MAVVEREVDAPSSEVWSILADGWLYPTWVVGAARMRGVEASYPATGARLHHSVGCWPVLIDDVTEVLECDPGSRLKLRAKGWPLGEATVEVRLTEREGGCIISMEELPKAGPALTMANPVGDRLLQARNRECVRRLAQLAEGRAR